MDALQALFHADGEGLHEDIVAEACTGVSDLITVLQLDTEVLVENLKQVSMFPSPTLVMDIQILHCMHAVQSGFQCRILACMLGMCCLLYSIGIETLQSTVADAFLTGCCCFIAAQKQDSTCC